MTIIASIDGATRRIYLHADTVGTTVHPTDIYREMRTMRRTDENLRKYDLFMEASGNIPKGSGKFTERLVTLLLGTRIVPFDVSHELTINGTIITDEGTEGIACFDRSSLSALTVVDINYVPPQVEVIVISPESGLTPVQDNQLSEIHGQGYREIYLDPTLGVNGNGYQQSPFNNLTDAIDEAENNGLTGLVLLGDIVLDRDLKNFTVTGVGLPTIDFAGHNLKNCSFYRCQLEGLFIDSIIGTECVLLNNGYLNGFYKSCALNGDLFCIPNSQVLLEDCMSNIAGLGRPSISMSAGTVKLSLRGQKGGLDIRDCNQAGDEATVEMMPGSVSINASCTAGEIVLRGVGVNQINTSADIITDEMVHSITTDEMGLIAKYVWDYSISAINGVESIGNYVITKLLSFKQFIGLK